MRTRTLLALLPLLPLLAAACGAYSFPGSPTPTPSLGSVSGRVLAFPCAPVEPAGTKCGGRPVAGLRITYQDRGATVSTITDSGGNYAVQLAPGAWNVRFATYMRIISGPTTVTVSAGSAVVADYLIDSGIRAPAPQPQP